MGNFILYYIIYNYIPSKAVIVGFALRINGKEVVFKPNVAFKASGIYVS